MNFYLKKFVFIVLPLIVALTGLNMMTHALIKKRVEAGLREIGFTDPVIGESSFRGKIASFAPITFDKNDFSKITSLRIWTPFVPALLQRPFKDVVVDEIFLTASVGDGEGFDVAGWKPAKTQILTHLTQLTPFHGNFQTIALNAGQLDLATPFSALRLQAKGQVERDEKLKAFKLHGALWSVQHVLQTDTAWDGSFGDDGKWVIDLTLNDSRFDFDGFGGSRISGWLSMKRDKPEAGLPAIGGQIDAGKIQIGKLAFSDITLTLDGPLDAAHILLSASVPAYPGMHVGVDFKGSPRDATVDAAIETDKASELMSFMRDLRDSRDNKLLDTSILMPLLLTEGNLTRIETQLKHTKFTRLELEIAGSLDDLTGKIIAKTINGDTTERHIISLDPGDVNRRK
jgi:hypothetical protein